MITPEEEDYSDCCIFCKIASGSAPAAVLYKDDIVTAFEDTHPIAPIHVLIIPNNHYSSLNHTDETDEILLGHLIIIARKLAKEMGIDSRGYRLVINTGPEAGQSVNHLHLHLIGGKKMPVSLYRME